MEIKKLELVGEAKADEVEEKEVFDVEYEQNLPEGESERSTGPLPFDLDLEDELDIFFLIKNGQGGDISKLSSLYFFSLLPQRSPSGRWFGKPKVCPRLLL